MNDLEMTKACATAMGIELCRSPDCEKFPMLHGDFHDHYDPLHDDAQAMALVKKFGLCIDLFKGVTPARWEVYGHPNKIDEACGESVDLNRAIVECVAKMRRNHE